MLSTPNNNAGQDRYDDLFLKSSQEKVELKLPQQVPEEERQKRQYDLSLKRLQYNYMRSYPNLEGVPVSAELPVAELYDEHYEKLLSESQDYIVHNFKTVLLNFLEKQLTDNATNARLEDFVETGKMLKSESGLMDFFKDITAITASLPGLVETAANSLSNYPSDVRKIIVGVFKVLEQSKIEGPTAYLKSALYETLAHNNGRDYLHAESLQDYKDLHQQLPVPLMLDIPRQDWMDEDSMPCEQDWFFSWLTVAGFNTTLIHGVTESHSDMKNAITLDDLLTKMPLTDAQFQKVIDDPHMTLYKASKLKRLYVVDYAAFEGMTSVAHHGDQRYMVAPIILFYFNPNPPEGYQPNAEGVLQPVAIQCNQKHDPIECPIFTPNDACDANDPDGYKWIIAKFLANAACAIHHESIAHFGDCHLTVEPAVLATHRQLSVKHPLYKLLYPHFRFNININDDARHKLIAPGGVIATNVGPAIDQTLKAIAKYRHSWKWDENNPENLFKNRAITQDWLPDFPFRDDTMLLWEAIKKFVSNYIHHYYQNDQEVLQDSELQNWIFEMTSPIHAHFQGMDGLTETGDPERPYQLDNREYLIEIIAHLIYRAGPQHANANYAQYPLMSYMPCVAGTIYHPAPTKNTEIDSEKDLLKWYPPLDVALYTFSFEYLLSSIQYDKLGHYDTNLRHPYFDDPAIQELVADFQEDLADIEKEIRKRNKKRPYPYTFQLPSWIPNSISI